MPNVIQRKGLTLKIAVCTKAHWVFAIRLLGWIVLKNYRGERGRDHFIEVRLFGSQAQGECAHEGTSKGKHLSLVLEQLFFEFWPVFGPLVVFSKSQGTLFGRKGGWVWVNFAIITVKERTLSD